MAIFLTLIHRGSVSQDIDIEASSQIFNISFSTIVLIIFVILTLVIFSGLLRGKKVVQTPG
jgi:hypothetical protein